MNGERILVLIIDRIGKTVALLKLHRMKHHWKIQVHGDVPGNNAVRYIIFTVENEEGIKREVKVAQYPLEYITNIQGWYSYRSDFGGTTWENYRDPSQKRVSAYNYDSRNDTWSYSATRYGNDYIFTSKVAEEIETGSNRGKSSISYYYYNRWQTSLSTNEIWNAGNARMYHVQITASSGDYTLGQPRITNGKTDPGEDNAELVSPSFMIASQLGAVFLSVMRKWQQVTVENMWKWLRMEQFMMIGVFQHEQNWKLSWNFNIKKMLQWMRFWQDHLIGVQAA